MNRLSWSPEEIKTKISDEIANFEIRGHRYPNTLLLNGDDAEILLDEINQARKTLNQSEYKELKEFMTLEVRVVLDPFEEPVVCLCWRKN